MKWSVTFDNPRVANPLKISCDNSGNAMVVDNLEQLYVSKQGFELDWIKTEHSGTIDVVMSKDDSIWKLNTYGQPMKITIEATKLERIYLENVYLPNITISKSYVNNGNQPIQRLHRNYNG